jgi:hypothetical protein
MTKPTSACSGTGWDGRVDTASPGWGDTPEARAPEDRWHRSAHRLRCASGVFVGVSLVPFDRSGSENRGR